MADCPSCFRPLDDNRFHYVCVGSCPTMPDPVASSFGGYQTTTKPQVYLSRHADAGRKWSPTAPACSRCHGETREICETCHYALPPDWRAGQATRIALAGARATGKSVYIGVVVKQMELLAQLLQSSLSPATQSTRRLYEEFYERPLYEQRGILKPTPTASTANSPQREPLIFTLGRVGGVTRYVVLRDVAGEDLEASATEEEHLSFFAFADTVLFMFDPLRVDAIREVLRDVIPAQLLRGGDPVAVLETVRSIISRGRARAGRAGQRPPHIGVVLSKFDAMHALSKVNSQEWQPVMLHQGAAFCRDPSLEKAAYDRRDGELLHHEVRSLMHKLNATSLVNTLENPSRGEPLTFQFFAVSALGTSANGEMLAGRGIASFRCLDPIKWALAGHGVLPVAS